MLKSLSELKAIANEAEALLLPLANAGPDHILMTLQPRDQDYAKVFIGGAAEQARAGYVSLWLAPPNGLAKPGQTEVRAVALHAASLGGETEFPGGYRKIVQYLQPEQIWVRFKFVAPGQSMGMAYDGLVWLSDHWAWFPKPWRILTSPGSN